MTFLTPVIFTEPRAVTTTALLAGAVTFVPIDSREPPTFWLALGATAVVAAALVAPPALGADACVVVGVGVTSGVIAGAGA
ncbi:MAG: hypothetical protein H0W96_17110, partial [Solirubrobacterales bacterium]|nr:hypothetical protein [Solirubrobacterales bacterium]